MLKLKDILLEFLLSEITENTSLYHRSSKKMEVGETINPKLEGGSHWLQSKPAELALEEERKLSKRNVPSRFSCIFSSLIPRSRFVDKGYLYRIKPTGRIFVADSILIDEINDRFDREYYDYMSRYDYEERKIIEKEFKDDPSRLIQFMPSAGHYYWQGINPTKNNIKDVEVLSDGAEVLEVINEDEKSTPFVVGDDVIVTEDGKLKADLTLYVNSHKDLYYRHISSSDSEHLIKFIQHNVFNNVEPTKNKYTENTFSFSGRLKKGTKLKIISISHSQRSGREQSYDKGKYSQLMFDFYMNGKLISRDMKKNEYDVFHRFTVSKYDNTDVYNFSKFLKKV